MFLRWNDIASLPDSEALDRIGRSSTLPMTSNRSPAQTALSLDSLRQSVE
jgi:hypothetical protein